MATIKIYNDIQTSDEKAFMRLVGADEGITFRDINEFVGSIPTEDNNIDIRLHCNGGSVTEGWAMYDCLRMSGKNITATVEGTCASMATVILMAAPKEKRYAYENAHLLLHYPYMCPAALGDMATADTLSDAAKNLRAEQDKMVDLYVERCGCDREELTSLMAEDRMIDAKEALRLGVIGQILPPLTAKHIEKTMEVKESLITRMLAKLGFKTLDEAQALESSDEVKAMNLNTADGTNIFVVREEGTPQVGDYARPDGEWTMEDGSVIVVENGVITEIRPADAPEEVEDAVVTEEGVTTELDERDDEEQRLRDRIAELEKENEELRQRVEELGGKAKTEDEERILGLVALAGGEDALARISSSYVPEQRQPKGAKASSIISASDILEKYNSVYKK